MSICVLYKTPHLIKRISNKNGASMEWSIASRNTRLLKVYLNILLIENQDVTKKAGLLQKRMAEWHKRNKEWSKDCWRERRLKSFFLFFPNWNLCENMMKLLQFLHSVLKFFRGKIPNQSLYLVCIIVSQHYCCKCEQYIVDGKMW